MKTKVSSKGQVVIPKAYRQKLGWESGTELEVHEEAGQLVLRKPATQRKKLPLSAVAGRMHRPGAKTVTLAEMEQAVMQEVRKRIY
jgi:AbrB family looped-hinge helix DNA binding protein